LGALRPFGSSFAVRRLPCWPPRAASRRAVAWGFPPGRSSLRPAYLERQWRTPIASVSGADRLPLGRKRTATPARRAEARRADEVPGDGMLGEAWAEEFGPAYCLRD